MIERTGAANRALRMPSGELRNPTKRKQKIAITTIAISN
jgi:hypothetical protein